MPKLNLKPNHKAIRDYYATLQQYERHAITHEGAVSSPFETLLHWTTGTPPSPISEHTSQTSQAN